MLQDHGVGVVGCFGVRPWGSTESASDSEELAVECCGSLRRFYNRRPEIPDEKAIGCAKQGTVGLIVEVATVSTTMNNLIQGRCGSKLLNALWLWTFLWAFNGPKLNPQKESPTPKPKNQTRPPKTQLRSRKPGPLDLPSPFKTPCTPKTSTSFRV